MTTEYNNFHARREKVHSFRSSSDTIDRPSTYKLQLHL